jgi:hypothetical protein
VRGDTVAVGALEQLVERLRARRSEIVAVALTRVGEVLEPDSLGADYSAGLSTAVDAAIGFGLIAISLGGPWPGPVPAAVLEQARLAARRRVPFEVVTRRYVIGAHALTEFVLAEVARLDPSPEPAAAVLGQATAAVFALLDRLIAEVGGAYQETLQAATSSKGQRLAAHVARILAGEPESSTVLDYDIDAMHVGLLADGPGGEATLRRLAQALERPALTVASDEQTTWGWIGGRNAVHLPRLEREVKRAYVGDETILAVGQPAAGMTGFRTTHRQAAEAMHIARRSGRPRLTRYADVALLAHTLRDKSFARTLIDLHVRPLGDGRDGVTLRATLCAYLAAQGNIATAAAALQVHRNTVSRRIAEIERRLDRPLDRCRGEIELALKLESLLGDDDR